MAKVLTDNTQDALVCLEGTPAEVGSAFGGANAADIQAEVSGFLADGGDRNALLRATARYRELVERYAPHWLEEAAALAESAGVQAEDYVAYQGAKYRGVNRPECFTYFSAPANNSEKVTLFHKNRDNVGRPQSAYVKGRRLSGQAVYRFAAIGDTSDMGTMMGLNERGLAAAADTGPSDPNPRYRGMMNPDVMRLILEQAADAHEAQALLERIHRDRAYAGGKIATNWMFADRHGRALRLCQYHERLEEAHDQDGMLVMGEDERGNVVLHALREARGDVTPALMNRLSRTPPVLADGNISGMTAAIPSSEVELFGYAECALCHAGRTAYVPLYLGCAATPRAMVDGTLYRLSVAQRPDLSFAADDFESALSSERECFEAAARTAREEQGVDAAREVLTQGCLTLANRAAEYLAGPQGRDAQ